MPVKILKEYYEDELEKAVNDFLKSKPEMTNPKFYYSITSYGYKDRSDNDQSREIYSVLISW